MDTDTNAVKEVEKTEPAAVQSDTSSASDVSTEDLLQVIEAKDNELNKVKTERENYKRGMLKAKGKLEDDEDTEPEDMESLIDRKVNEKLLQSRESQLQKEKDDAIKALAKRNRELETALKNRSGISTGAGTGSNNDNIPTVSDNMLSNEQIKTLKAKGWNDEKIELFKKNLARNKA